MHHGCWQIVVPYVGTMRNNVSTMVLKFFFTKVGGLLLLSTL